MKRDVTARRRIQQYLLASGPVVDPSGYATTLLKDAVNYTGSPVAFIQLIAAMDRANEIEREVRGKRTYRISAVTADVPATAGSRVTPPISVQAGANGGIDYEKLARAIVRELWLAVTAQAVPGAPYPLDTERAADEGLAAAEREEYVRRLQVARETLDELLGTEVPTPESSATH